MSLQNKTNYYEILEISTDATQDEIKRAFRKLAKKYHPDMNPNNPNVKDIMQKITVAYEVLSDVEKRKEYDRQHFDELHFERSKSYSQAKENTKSNFDTLSIILLKMYGIYDARDSELERLRKVRAILIYHSKKHNKGR